MQKKIFRSILTIFLCVTLLPSSVLANNSTITIESSETDLFATQLRQDWLDYTLADLAAIRFACYGVLDESYLKPNPKTNEPLTRIEAVQLLYEIFAETEAVTEAIPFTDVDKDNILCVSWAYKNGITNGTSSTKFGTSNISKNAFVVFLLRALGYDDQFERSEAISYAAKLGLSPVGLSKGFTLGDALLYLQEAISQFNIPHAVVLDQVCFPRYVSIYPQTVNEIEPLIKAAVNYLPRCIYVYMDNPTEARTAYKQYRNYYEQLAKQEYQYDLWFYPLLDNHAHIFRVDPSETGFSIDFAYSKAWELTRNLDDTFEYFVSDIAASAADDLYQKWHDSLPAEATDRQKTESAINYICQIASYDYAEEQAINRNQYDFHPKTHSILGLLENGKIVCDGYAYALQYLLLREGIECLVIDGSTTANTKSAKHAWNKVKVDGQWWNVDVCWTDIAGTSKYNFKTDVQYLRLAHFPHIYNGGMFV